jgi:anti-anti-sigma factor
VGRKYDTEIQEGLETRLQILKKSFAGIPVLEVDGDLDHLRSDLLEGAIRQILDGSDRLLVDLVRCAYMDSGGLTALLSAARDLPPAGWLGIVGGSKNILRLFEIVGMSSYPGVRMFDDYPALERSLDAEANRVM